jgi:hypothetical protein
MLRGGKDIWKDTDLSVLVSRDIRPFKFSLATTSAATDRFEHGGSLSSTQADKVTFTFSHGRTGPRQVPDDHGGKGRRGVGSTLRRSSPRPVLLPSVPQFFSSFLGVALFFSLRVPKYHG